jgi:hypothetical protein
LIDGFALRIVEIHHSLPAHVTSKSADPALITPQLTPSPAVEMEGVQWN